MVSDLDESLPCHGQNPQQPRFVRIVAGLFHRGSVPSRARSSVPESGLLHIPLREPNHLQTGCNRGSLRCSDGQAGQGFEPHAPFDSVSQYFECRDRASPLEHTDVSAPHALQGKRFPFHRDLTLLRSCSQVPSIQTLQLIGQIYTQVISKLHKLYHRDKKKTGTANIAIIDTTIAIAKTREVKLSPEDDFSSTTSYSSLKPCFTSDLFSIDP